MKEHTYITETVAPTKVILTTVSGKKVVLNASSITVTERCLETDDQADLGPAAPVETVIKFLPISGPLKAG